jgi:prevent-host-death family protein
MPTSSLTKHGVARAAKKSLSATAGRRAVVDASTRASAFTVNATQAKNRFGEILRHVSTSSPVFIEKHGSRLAVVLDAGSYDSLVLRARDAQQIQLDALRDEFDALYADMQTARSRRAVKELSTISAERLTSVIAKRRG